MKSTVHLWTITAILLGFFVLTHLGVMVSFLTSHALLPWVAPLALGLALWMGDGWDNVKDYRAKRGWCHWAHPWDSSY